MMYNFDKPVDRHGTDCVKWDSSDDTRLLNLWVADMDFETAPAVIEALRRRVDHGIFGYTFPHEDYYDALCSWFERRHRWKIDRNTVQYTTGVVPALSACIKAITHPGDGVIIMTPVYTCFFSSIRNNGCRIIESPLRTEGRTFAIDFDDLRARCEDADTTALVLCNPHNPAARAWTADELHRIDEICSENGVTVISDEIHCEIVLPGFHYTPYATVARGPHIVCCSPSKAFNTAGLHIANIICPDADMRARIDRAINDNETCDVGPFGITGLIAAYNHGEEWLDALIEYIADNYTMLRTRIESMPYGLKVTEQQATYLAWIDVHSLGVSVGELCTELVHDAHVRFTPGTEYGSDGEGYIRINMATRREVLAEALDRFANYISEHF